MLKFYVQGFGPVVSVGTHCNKQWKPYTQTAPITKGSGSKILSTYLNTYSIDMNIQVILPTAGFGNLKANTTWVSQFCSVRAYLGHGFWTFQWQTDEWQMGVPVGNAVDVDINNDGEYFIDASTDDIYSSTYEKILSEQEGDSHFMDEEEATILTTVLHRALYNTLDDKWYTPTQGIK
jgi:hypothetical protein